MDMAGKMDYINSDDYLITPVEVLLRLFWY